jgi:hypothetical protein
VGKHRVAAKVTDNQLYLEFEQPGHRDRQARWIESDSSTSLRPKLSPQNIIQRLIKMQPEPAGERCTEAETGTGPSAW